MTKLHRQGGKQVRVVRTRKLRRTDDEHFRCGACEQPVKVTTTGRLRPHKDPRGDDCPNRRGPGVIIDQDALADALAEVHGTNTLPATGRCHDCDKPVTGERRFCGQCMSRRLS